MSKIRKTLTALPFVEEQKDGTLDLWAMDPPTTDCAIALKGRAYAALLMHVMRDYDAAFMCAHVMTAMRESGFKYAEVGTYFTTELARTAVEGSVAAIGLLASVSHLRFEGNPRQNLLAIPQVTETPEGRLRLWPVPQDRDYDDLVAAGRYYAVCVIRYMMKTEDLSILNRIARAMQDAPGADVGHDRPDQPFLVGFWTAVAEVSIAAGETSTAYQYAMLSIYKDVAEDVEGDTRAAA